MTFGCGLRAAPCSPWFHRMSCLKRPGRSEGVAPFSSLLVYSYVNSESPEVTMNNTLIESSSVPARINAALFILRVASALVFLYHGSAILFGAFGGPGPGGFAAFMHMPVAIG